MTSVLFTFTEATSERVQNELRQQLLERGVPIVARLSPNARRPSLRRMWYAEVYGTREAVALTLELKERDEIETAEMPGQRALLG